MSYKQAIDAAKAEDNGRGTWNAQEWRAYFLEEVGHVQSTPITRTNVLAILGPTSGSMALDAVKAGAPHIYEAMSVSEGGVDLSHPDAAAFISSLPIPATAKAKFSALATVVKAPRHRTLGLPDPRERLMEEAMNG